MAWCQHHGETHHGRGRKAACTLSKQKKWPLREALEKMGISTRVRF